MSDGRYKCPECDGEFQDPVDVTTRGLKVGVGFVKYDAKGCPWCAEPLSGTLENPRKSALFSND